MSNLLEIRGLTAAYGRTAVLHGIDLSVKEGEAVALLGANGAGKSTTLRAICQMTVETGGQLNFRGGSIKGKAPHQIAQMGVGHVPDGRGTFTGLTTEENLRLVVSGRRGKREALDGLEQIYSYFPRLKERRSQQAGTLSGGEQQMLAIGRALMGRPRLLLLDEPSFGVAPLLVRSIFEILRRINREEKVTILLVEQNARIALEFADRAYVLETGRVALEGSAAEIKRNDAIRRAYLGE